MRLIAIRQITPSLIPHTLPRRVLLLKLSSHLHRVSFMCLHRSFIIRSLFMSRRIHISA